MHNFGSTTMQHAPSTSIVVQSDPPISLTPLSTLTDALQVLPEPVVGGLVCYGFDALAPVQQWALPAAATGHDLVIQAQSGSGKTGAFVAAALRRHAPGASTGLQVVVASPTHELAAQTTGVLAAVGRFVDCRALLLPTATPGPDATAVVGAPRALINDLASRNTENVTCVVFDEIDQQLGAGVIGAEAVAAASASVGAVLAKLPASCQRIFVSATVTDQTMTTLLDLGYLRTPYVALRSAASSTVAERISQRCVLCPDDQARLETAAIVASRVAKHKVIVFANTQKDVKQLASLLSRAGVQTGVLHAGVDPKDRTRAVAAFASGATHCLVTTDVAGRGLDVPDIACSISAGMPPGFWQRDPGAVAAYVHRIGRSARGGRRGFSVAVLLASEVTSAQKILATSGSDLQVANAAEVAEQLAKSLFE